MAELDHIKDPRILKDIMNWVDSVDQPRDQLDGLKICPYAKSFVSNLQVIRLPFPEIFHIDEDFVMIIFIASDLISKQDLKSYATQISEANPELVFLTDHLSTPTFMNNQQTNNAIYNAILCQPNHKLKSARAKLQSTQYYNYWTAYEWDHLLKARNILPDDDV
jgi:hypothetical protein